MTLILKFLWLLMLMLGMFFLSPDNKQAFMKRMTQNHIVESQGDFAHVVLFWLKNPKSEKDKTAFRNSLEKFVNSSEYIQTMHLGEPADTHREVIDRSYTYIMVLTFKSKEDQDKYQEEEVHKQFVRESEKLWSKVTVMDSNNLW